MKLKVNKEFCYGSDIHGEEFYVTYIKTGTYNFRPETNTTYARVELKPEDFIGQVENCDGEFIREMSREEVINNLFNLDGTKCEDFDLCDLDALINYNVAEILN